jgi:hypothetical protein
MIASKRRPASTQAVRRKVEGIELRKQYNRKDDALNSAEVNTGTGEIGEGCARLLGVGDHGMRDSKTTRQPGRSCRCFQKEDHADAGEERTLRVCQTTAQGERGKRAAGSRIV